VITGYNTDIEHDGVVYHVQTEDKGLSSPIILSLVYNRGTILASKRSPYDDLAAGGLDEGVLAERLQRQHKLMCAAIRAGRIEDLKAMTAANRKSNAGQEAVPDKETLPAKKADPVATEPPAVSERPQTDEAEREQRAGADAESEMAIPMPPGSIDLLAEMRSKAPTLADFGSAPAEDVIPIDAVQVVSELAGAIRPQHENLNIELVGDAKFKAGEDRTVCIMVARGTQQKVVSGAEILAKVLGSGFRPHITHARTDKNGIASLDLKVPKFASGRAAVIVRVKDGGEEAELRRVVARA
jgi:hypothetical protein